MSLFRLDGKIALVTGGAGIYGRHIVRALAEAGATVYTASRDAKKCEAFAAELSREGLSVIGGGCDLASEPDVRFFRDRIVAESGRLDVLVNNSVARSGGDLGTATAATWEETMRVNSTGFFLACKIFSEPMQAMRSGSIINIASIYGMVGPDFSIYEGTKMYNPVDYAFSKGGMINMTRYLASYLAPWNIRVNSLSPGGFQTEAMPEPFLQAYKRRTLLRRMADDDDIKGPIVFLASEGSRYVTGQNIPVDGGWTAT
ncbi:MAG: SDR family oxidoreductase [Bryobacteraceae bacterium]